MVAGSEGIAMSQATSPKPDSAIWQTESNPITTSSFLPPPVPRARAWQRIPVPAVTRPCKIWKRTVSEPGSHSDGLQYVLAAAELESQGQHARKRARKEGHVRVWGDAQWDKRVDEPRDGSWDLVEARAAVAELHEDDAEHVEATMVTARRPATFPEDRLRWVPRKRHNSRWPIEPTTTTKMRNAMVAELQPLVEFEVPSASIETAAAQHSPQRATEKQMRRRSTRRLSTRVSFADIEDVAVSQSPSATATRESRAATSSTKSSPTKKVSTSPQKSFTLLATPAKVLFKPSPPKTRSPAAQASAVKAAQFSPPTTVVETSDVDDSSLLSDTSVLVFESEVRPEPAYETRRRVSLQNAMRLERPSSRGARRSLGFDTTQSSLPSRRHSFVPQSMSTLIGTKNRRHTLDFSGARSTVDAEMEQDEEITTGFSSAETTENISEVVVDVCANLDIFGQKSGVTRRRKARPSSSTAQQQETVEAVMPKLHDGDATASTPSSSPASRRSHDVVDDSPVPIGLGITYTPDAAIDSPDQSAMLDTSFNMHAEEGDEEADTPGRDFWLDDGIGSTPYERPSNPEFTREDEVQQEDMFAPHDPEGLSTIFEDEEVSFTESAGVPSASLATTELASSDVVETRHQAPVTTEEVMEQSFDLTLEADDVVASSPAKSLDDEDSVVGQERSECYPSPPDDDSSANVMEDDFCGTVTVEDLPAQEDVTLVVDDFSSPARTVSIQSQEDEGGLDETDDHGDEDKTLVVEDFSSPARSSLPQGQEDGEHMSEALEHNDVGSIRDSSPISQVEVASSPSAEVEDSSAPTSTPPQATDLPGHDVETVLDTPPSQGFIAINSDRVSPLAEQFPTADDINQEDADDLQDEDMALAMDYEPTVPINLDEDNLTIEAPESDAQPAAPEEESEAEMLRKFVTRVSANKAAAALAKRNNLRPKRRSGSTGSTTSGTGSPGPKTTTTITTTTSSLSAESAQRMMAASMASSPAPPPRRPLGEMDANSPSPTKKRKVSGSSKGHHTDSDDLFKGNPTLYSAEISPPKSKRLRGRRQQRTSPPDDTTTPSTTTNNQGDLAQENEETAPRRSTRSRSSRVRLNAPAPSANSIALSSLSHIPVRLPGSSSTSILSSQADLLDMPTPIVVPRAARTTAAEKDLAAVTRVNTRKNKAGAVPPRVVLSRQVDGGGEGKEGEGKGTVFDATDDRENGDDEERESGQTSRKGGKGVRWASELVRFNTDLVDEDDIVARPSVAGPLVSVIKGRRIAPVLVEEKGVEVEFDQAAVGVVAGPAQDKKQEKGENKEDNRAENKEENKPAPTRRTRQSRLQPPTPVSKKILGGAASADASGSGVTATACAGVTAKGAAQATVASASASGVVKMATRRTKIASLGMGVNGTPAPKRRTRT